MSALIENFDHAMVQVYCALMRSDYHFGYRHPIEEARGDYMQLLELLDRVPEDVNTFTISWQIYATKIRYIHSKLLENNLDLLFADERYMWKVKYVNYCNVACTYSKDERRGDLIEINKNTSIVAPTLGRMGIAELAGL